MNKVILIGRLVADPDFHRTSGEKPTTIARYRLAVDRKYKRNGEQSTDFISCVAFGNNGDFAKKYLTKGIKIAIEGHIQTGSYTDKEGNKVYTTDVVVESHEFCESKKSSGNDIPGGYSNYAVPYGLPQSNDGIPVTPTDGEFDLMTDDDSELPF